MTRTVYLNDPLSADDMVTVNHILALRGISARQPGTLTQVLNSLLPMPATYFVSLNRAITHALEGLDAHTTNEDIQPTDAASMPLPVATSHMAGKPGASHIDALAELDRVLDDTPAHTHVCRPLKRTLVAAAAAEIRRLRVAVAAGPHGDDGKAANTTL